MGVVLEWSFQGCLGMVLKYRGERVTPWKNGVRGMRGMFRSWVQSSRERPEARFYKVCDKVWIQRVWNTYGYNAVMVYLGTRDDPNDEGYSSTCRIPQ